MESTVIEWRVEKKKVQKKRAIKTKKGATQEVTEVIITEVEGENPEISITIEEIKAPTTEPALVLGELLVCNRR